MSDYGSENVKCPFYLRDEPYRIKCEGLTEGNNIHLVFGNSKKLKSYLVRVCCNNYRQCRLFKMLEEKYN